jgi:hypothetical protein
MEQGKSKLDANILCWLYSTAMYQAMKDVGLDQWRK